MQLAPNFFHWPLNFQRYKPIGLQQFFLRMSSPATYLIRSHFSSNTQTLQLYNCFVCLILATLHNWSIKMLPLTGRGDPPYLVLWTKSVVSLHIGEGLSISGKINRVYQGTIFRRFENLGAKRGGGWGESVRYDGVKINP